MRFDSGGRLLGWLVVVGVVLCWGEVGLRAETHRTQTPSLRTPRLPALKREIPTAHYLVAHLPLSGNGLDVSGNGNHAMVHGATLTADRFGRAGRAYSFDGVDDYLELANERRFDLTTFTIAMHVEVSALPASVSPAGAGEYTLISKGENAGTFTVELSRWGGASIGAVSYAQRTARGTWDSGNVGPIVLNRFHHIAVTAEGSVLRLYIDGQLKLERTDAGPRVLNDTPVLIGRSAGAVSPNWFKGIIDDVRIYSRALSAQEIEQLRGATDE